MLNLSIVATFLVLASNFCVDINTAPQEELERIKNIGESRAKQIITLRGEKLFSSIDDLDRVVGIGPTRIADIKQEGLACVEVILQQELEIGSPSIVEYPSGIIINEIMPSPEGPDETEEWIKIFNKNNFEVDLQGWQIADTIGKITAYTIPAGRKIPALGFLILGRPETKIILNNEGDGLNLIKPDGKIADFISYEKAALGQSYGPGAAKIVEEIKKDSAGVAVAAISEPVIAEQSRHNFYPLVAFILAILSGFVILFLKHVRA